MSDHMLINIILNKKLMKPKARFIKEKFFLNVSKNLMKTNLTKIYNSFLSMWLMSLMR